MAGSSEVWWVGGTAIRENIGSEMVGNTCCEGMTVDGVLDAWKYLVSRL